MKNRWMKKLMILLSGAMVFSTSCALDEDTLSSLATYVVETGVSAWLDSASTE